MHTEKRAFASFRVADKWFYEDIREQLRSKGIIVYDTNLYNLLNEKHSRLFNLPILDKELSHPDFAIVLLSENLTKVKNYWLEDELRALYALEQFRGTNFLVPILFGEIKDSSIPKYFKEKPGRIIDFRGKSRDKGLNDLVKYMNRATKPKVFIGHGHSSAWKDLKEYLEKRHGLECDEFEDTSPVGKSIKERLSEMLNDPVFAFIVMTAEDEHVSAGGEITHHARENVIHEAGLFQGRLGFQRVVILLEEGCSQFSNMDGIITIRFPRRDISSRFEEIRKVLVREGIISS
jgi:hypothetical protein